MGDVLLVRLAGGRAVAFSATCPHQATDLGDGRLAGERIRCRLHHYEYDVVSGENVVPARGCDPADLWKSAPGYLRVFAVEERDGWVWVDEEPRPPPASFDPVREQPPPRRAATEAGPVEGAPVRTVVGTTFELRLPAGPPRPGFVWRVEVEGRSVAVVGQRAESGDHVVRLAARVGGQSIVRCAYARPWDREPAEVRIYEVVVEGG